MKMEDKSLEMADLFTPSGTSPCSCLIIWRMLTYADVCWRMLTWQTSSHLQALILAQISQHIHTNISTNSCQSESDEIGSPSRLVTVIMYSSLSHTKPWLNWRRLIRRPETLKQIWVRRYFPKWHALSTVRYALYSIYYLHSQCLSILLFAFYTIRTTLFFFISSALLLLHSTRVTLMAAMRMKSPSVTPLQPQTTVELKQFK
jgi:hypothetical protein